MWLERGLLIANLLMTSWLAYRLSDVQPQKLSEKWGANDSHSGRIKFKPQPFAKPSGKRAPKVNDDEAGWRKENELP